jgi:1-deoxy-D-xylulose-5-phosphate reductoisomerase
MECSQERLTIEKMAQLTFERPDYETFECLAAGTEAAKKGGLAPTAANASNEIAVQLFLDGKIRFLDIGEMVHEAVSNAVKVKDFTLEELLEYDHEIREKTLEKAART